MCYKQTVKDLNADEEASVFRALADPTRRQILEDLNAGERTAGDIALKPVSARVSAYIASTSASIRRRSPA